MKTIAFYSIVGGCGKTTATLNIAKQLAQMGLMVLCIDTDPRASLTARIGLSEQQKKLINEGLSISSVLMGEKSIVDCSIAVKENLFFVGTEIPDKDIEIPLPIVSNRIQAKSPNHNRLHRVLSQAETKFDVCLIDCQPAANVLAINAIYASDYIITPVRLDDESPMYVGSVARMVAEIRDLTDRAPELKGLIFTQTNPATRLYKRTWPGVVALGLPVLAEIRLFAGADASLRIWDSHSGVTSKILKWVKE